MAWVMMWIFASSHATHRPLIQILSVFAIAIVHLSTIGPAARSHGTRARHLDHPGRDPPDMAPNAAPALFIGLDGSAIRIRHGQFGFAGLGPFAQHERASGVRPQLP